MQRASIHAGAATRAVSRLIRQPGPGSGAAKNGPSHPAIRSLAIRLNGTGTAAAQSCWRTAIAITTIPMAPGNTMAPHGIFDPTPSTPLTAIMLTAAGLRGGRGVTGPTMACDRITDATCAYIRNGTAGDSASTTAIISAAPTGIGPGFRAIARTVPPTPAGAITANSTCARIPVGATNAGGRPARGTAGAIAADHGVAFVVDVIRPSADRHRLASLALQVQKVRARRAVSSGALKVAISPSMTSNPV